MTFTNPVLQSLEIKLPFYGHMFGLIIGDGGPSDGALSVFHSKTRARLA